MISPVFLRTPLRCAVGTRIGTGIPGISPNSEGRGGPGPSRNPHQIERSWLWGDEEGQPPLVFKTGALNHSATLPQN